MTRWWIALGSVSAFTALAVSVHVGLLDELDSIVGEWARPHDVWGTVQVRANLVVHGLRPAVLAGLLAAFTVACGMKRRSMRLVWFVGSVCLATVALTAATKTAVGRPDTHGSITNGFGGSFPSGHVTTVMVCLGLVVLVARPRAGKWVWLIPALGGGLMAASLLLQATHWFTDVVGGGLLATGLLAVATSPGLSRWSHGGSAKDQSAASEPASSSAPGA
jgi:membrane-associated phospholipid phosphatase